jgi:hypothetical protein
VLKQHPRNTVIRNVRQLCVVSAEEMAEVARDMGLDRMDYAWVGASLVLEGIPDLTHLPPSSRLQGPDGVTLVVDMENLPCQEPAVTIDQALPGQGKGFKRAAEGKRGVTFGGCGPSARSGTAGLAAGPRRTGKIVKWGENFASACPGFVSETRQGEFGGV